MKKIILTTIFILSGLLIFGQKGKPNPNKPVTGPTFLGSCPLVLSIQDNNPTAVCSELLKTLVAVSDPCTDTTMVNYSWSSSIGGVFSTSRTTVFNLPEFVIATPLTVSVTAIDGVETKTASYTFIVKPRPARPTLNLTGSIILCENLPLTLSVTGCTGGSTPIWSNGNAGLNSIIVPPVGGTYFKVACEKNGCVSDSTAAVALVAATYTVAPTITDLTICEGVTITPGNGLLAQVAACGTGGISGSYSYSGGTVGYDDGLISSGGIDPKITIPSTSNIVKKLSVSITWRKQAGGFQNDCGTGNTLSNPFHNETEFRIKSPSGKIITLVNTGTYGGSANPTVTTVFEDGATPVNFYSPPVSGTFASAQPLSGFIGENPTGTWTLLPFDDFWRDPLCVSGFSLNFTTDIGNSITWWDAPNGGNLVGTGAEYIPTVTNPGAYSYFAQAQCGTNCPSPRVVANLTINYSMNAPIADVNIPLVNNTRNICGGESITLTATGCNPGTTTKWSSNYYGANFATGNSYTFTPTFSNTNDISQTFSAICDGVGLCKSPASNIITINVKKKPAIPIISGPGTTVCYNSNITLTASSCSGGTLSWSGNRSGNSLTFPLINAVNIKVACTINGCTSDSSAVYSNSPLPKPAIPTINSSQVQALCLGGNVTLSANGCTNGGIVKWTGGLTGSPITITPTLTNNYRASCLATNGCASDSSASLNIIVLQKTKPVISGNTFVCGPSSNTLTATGCSGANETILWRDQSTGNTLTETITATKTFRAVCIRNGYCVSDSSDIFTVQYRIKPSQPTITPPANSIVCQGNSITLTASACSGGSLNWTGGLIGQSINITSVGTKNFKVACTINGCTSDSSAVQMVTINPLPIFTVTADKPEICEGESSTLTVSGCTGTISWSNNAGNLTSIIVAPTTNTTFTSTCTQNGCSSSQTSTITALLTPKIVSSGTLNCGGIITLTAQNVPIGAPIQWRKDGVDIIGQTGTTLSVTEAGNYDFVVGKVISQVFEININNNGYHRNKAHFVNDKIGYLVIGNQIKKTIDGGINWGLNYSANSQYLSDIFFIDENYGWVVAENVLYKTINGGVNWSSISNSINFLKIKFKNNLIGIGISGGNQTFYTIDGGLSWTLSTGGNNSVGISNLDFIKNTNTAFSTGIDGVYKTNNNGVNWNKISNNQSLLGISFIDSNIGFVGSSTELHKTIDGGATWQSINISNLNLNGWDINIKFLNSSVGYLINQNNSQSIFKTIDGGLTWKLFEFNSISNQFMILSYSMDFFKEDNGGYLFTYRTGSGNDFAVFKKISTPQCSTNPLNISPPTTPKPAKPIITSTGNIVCQPQNITLTASACTGGTLGWTGGLTGQSIIISAVGTKNFKVACTINGCTSDSSLVNTIQIKAKPAQPTITPPPNATVCQGNSITLAASACTGGNLGWTGGLTGSSITISTVGTKSYKVACTINGCTSDSSVVQSITINPLPVISLTSNKSEICEGESATITVAGCTGTISWSNGAGNVASMTVSPTIVTNYTATCTQLGCSSTQQITITPLQTPKVTASGPLVCDQSITLTASNFPAGATIQWRKDGVDIVGATNTTLVVNEAGNYDFVVGKVVSNQISLENFENSVSKIQFITNKICFLINANEIRKSTNGGITWNISYVLNNTNGTINRLLDIFFIDELNGWATGLDNILRTTDGGNNWTKTSTLESFFKIKFKNSLIGSALSYANFVYYTNDGGQVWTRANSANSLGIYGFQDLTFVPNTNTVFAGGLGGLLKSTNNGMTWVLANGMLSSKSINFISSNTGYMVTSNELFKTIDGGNNWNLINNLQNCYQIKFVSENIGYYVNYNNSIIFKTKNGGLNWNIFENINYASFDGTYHFSINFFNEDNGGYIYKQSMGSLIESTFKKISTPQCQTTPAIVSPIPRPTGALVINTFKSGAWTDASTWNCGFIPSSLDEVIINPGHIITDTGNTLNAKKLIFNGNGTLQIAPTSILKLAN